MLKKEVCKGFFERGRWKHFVNGVSNLAKDFDVKLSFYSGVRNISLFDCSFTEEVYTKERNFRILPFLKNSDFFEDEESLAIVEALKNRELKYKGRPPVIDIGVCKNNEILGYVNYHPGFYVLVKSKSQETLDMFVGYF